MTEKDDVSLSKRREALSWSQRCWRHGITVALSDGGETIKKSGTQKKKNLIPLDHSLKPELTTKSKPVIYFAFFLLLFFYNILMHSFYFRIWSKKFLLQKNVNNQIFSFLYICHRQRAQIRPSCKVTRLLYLYVHYDLVN